MINSSYHLRIIVLAAGKSERFKGIKALAKIQQQANSITLLEHALQQISVSLNTLGIDENNLQVATGGYHSQIVALLKGKYTLTYCDNAHLGMGHTIAQSVEKTLIIENKTSHIMLMLADQVALNSDDYIRLIKQSLSSPDKLICAQAQQKIMPPAIFPNEYFVDLMHLNSDKGAKAILSKNQNNLERVIISNAVIDIDTQQDLLNWYSDNSQK